MEGSRINIVICMVWSWVLVMVEMIKFKVKLVEMKSKVLKRIWFNVLLIGMVKIKCFKLRIIVIWIKLIKMYGMIFFIINLMEWIGVVIKSFKLFCLCLCIIVVLVNKIMVMVKIILSNLGMIFIVEWWLGL